MQIDVKNDVMKYPIGIQTFDKIRKGNLLYVDKTDVLYRIVTKGQYYFLSRPRRFGKSLLISTLEAYFSGRKDLFEGLAIAGLEKDWTVYPVLRLDLSSSSYGSVDKLNDVIEENLRGWEAEYGISDTDTSIKMRFKNVIQTARVRTGRPVVVLVDEYEKPMMDNIADPELYDTFRNILQGFYIVIKSQDANIRFAFFTGVTKIGKLSVFSALNNINDISMDLEYSEICGITEDELHRYMADGVEEMAKANDMTVQECYARLKEAYDGYHFHPKAAGLYNPFSLLLAISKKEFGNYWFETGTPSFIVSLMEKTSYDITSVHDRQAVSSLLTSVDVAIQNPIPLLYLSGYLTIKDYDRNFGVYQLDFPNREVKDGFLNYLLQYSTDGKVSGAMLIFRLRASLRNGKPEDMMTELDAFFANKNYQMQADCEKDFQYAVSTIFELVGEDVRTERQTSNGRIDILIQTDRFVYIMELKVDASAEEALAQIEEKGYARPFAADSRTLYKIGVNFSTVTRRVEDWKICREDIQ